MMLDKEQIQAVFLSLAEWVGKQQKQLATFGPGTATKRTVQWWFKFCKRDESLEDAEHSGQLSVGDSNQLRVSLKLILLKLHEKLLKNSLLTILWLVDI